MVRSLPLALRASLFFVIRSNSTDERHLRRHQGHRCDIRVDANPSLIPVSFSPTITAK
jgi:hypothetical protein